MTTATMPSSPSVNPLSEKSLRIALLFREATLLDEPHWEEFARRKGMKGEKALGAVWRDLARDVSLRNFADLMRIDLVKGSVKTDAGPDFGDALSAPVRLSPADITHILKRAQPDVPKLCHFLISRGLLSTDDLVSALDAADSDALNIYDTLTGRAIVTPETVDKAVRDRDSTIGQDNRALLAGDMLIFNNLITKDDFSRALESRAVTGLSLARTMENLRLLTQEELTAALDHGVELPRVELVSYDVAPELLERFPEGFMKDHQFLPLAAHDSHFELGTADPFNLVLADTLALLTGRRVSLIYTSHQDLAAKFDLIYPPAEGGAGAGRITSMPAISIPRSGKAGLASPATVGAAGAATGTPGPNDRAGSDAGARVADNDFSRRTAEPFVDNLSTVQLVTQIVEGAIGSKATDIHIEPGADDVRVRFRVDGILHGVMRVPGEMQLSVISRIKVLAGMNVTERRRPQDGHFSLTTKAGAAYDFRVSTLPAFHGEKIVLRVLDSRRVLTGLEQTGLDEAQRDVMERLVTRPHGLLLVTGPTGSGKTSTLYAAMQMVNREDINILTIEDPIEYQLEGVTQVQVDTNIELTFAAGLRSALRQDPDVIMVGEIRDPETAGIAIRASLTGHLVMSTLHTNTAVGAISALAHMGIPNYLMGSALAGIVSQRLVRKVCEHCRKPYAAPKHVLRDLGLPEAGARGKKFAKGEGCAECFGTGYSGRTGIYEVVEVNDVVRRAIAEGSTEQELADLAAKAAPTLLRSGIAKAQAGVTTPEEVLRAVSLT